MTTYYAAVARSVAAILVSGFQCLSLPNNANAQTPPEIPSGRIAAHFFYYQVGTNETGSAVVFGRGPTPDEAILKFSQDATAKSTDGSTMTPRSASRY